MTAKQKAFCEEYVQCYVANQAYSKAYGISVESANKNAYKLLKNEECLAYIRELQKEAYNTACINAERIGLELANIAFDETGTYSATNKLKAVELLQKQLGLQTQNVKGSIDNKVEIVIEE